jgi:hypothetical protein
MLLRSGTSATRDVLAASYRPELLTELGRHWRNDAPKRFRISFDAHINGAKGSMAERRFAPVG